MFILPLHRPLTRATFPYATALLVILNVLVFFGAQAGDDEHREEAARYWVDAGLQQYEAPAYQRWREAHPDAPAAMDVAGVPGEVRDLVAIQADVAFLEDLRASRAITPTDAEYGEWKPLRDEFDRRWALSFTDRHVARFSEVSWSRMFTAMFLHGDAGHLFGNMLFLAFVGMLVEGALGSRQFLLLYLLGGMGSELASLAYRWGENGSALGASGAIAALMGAFCVLWGKRKVRFFWWFFVVFDYVRAPALWLLPVWLGWEVLNLMFNEGAGVGFDAHAGGLVSGALLATLVVVLGRERKAFLDADDGDGPVGYQPPDDRFQRALAHLAKLEVAQAKSLLAPLAAVADAPLPVRIAWYRCGRYEPAGFDLHGAVLRVLQARGGAADAVERMRIFEDYLKASGNRAGFPAAAGAAVARDWIEADSTEAAERLLSVLDADAAVADAWVALARRAHERGDVARTQRACAQVLDRYPDSPAANKARFLGSVGAA